MDKSKIDRSKKLTVNEAVEIMRSEGAVVAGEHVWGYSTIRRLDGYLQEHIVGFTDFESSPVLFCTLETWKEAYKRYNIFKYEIPMNAEQALENMRDGKVIFDTEDYQYLYFMDVVHNPLGNDGEYVFRVPFEDSSSYMPEIWKTPKMFLVDECGPHFGVYDPSEDNQEDAVERSND